MCFSVTTFQEYDSWRDCHIRHWNRSYVPRKTHKYTKVIALHCSFNNAWSSRRAQMLRVPLQAYESRTIIIVAEKYIKPPQWYLSLCWRLKINLLGTHMLITNVQASHVANRITFHEHALHFSRQLIPINLWLEIVCNFFLFPWVLVYFTTLGSFIEHELSMISVCHNNVKIHNNVLRD